jgi:hypothetical protein
MTKINPTKHDRAVNCEIIPDYMRSRIKRFEKQVKRGLWLAEHASGVAFERWARTHPRAAKEVYRRLGSVNPGPLPPFPTSDTFTSR